jgi:hypothetical protein
MQNDRLVKQKEKLRKTGRFSADGVVLRKWKRPGMPYRSLNFPFACLICPSDWQAAVVYI